MREPAHALGLDPALPVGDDRQDGTPLNDAQLDDARLVAAVLQRDRKAMAEFVSRHADSVYGYVRHRLVPRTDLADDLAQEVFLAALKGLRGFSGKSSLQSWLLGIARLRVADHYRKTLRRDEVFDETEDPVSGPVSFPEFEDELDRNRLKERTRRVLSQLPEAYAYVLVWRYWDHRSAREISADTGRTEKAVERLLARARVQFKRRWEDD